MTKQRELNDELVVEAMLENHVRDQIKGIKFDYQFKDLLKEKNAEITSRDAQNREIAYARLKLLTPKPNFISKRNKEEYWETLKNGKNFFSELNRIFEEKEDYFFKQNNYKDPEKRLVILIIDDPFLEREKWFEKEFKINNVTKTYLLYNK